MGTVYRAEHSQLRREVADQGHDPPRGGDERLVGRFFAEASEAVATLAASRRRHLLRCRSFQKPGPTPIYRDYFVMELIVGQDLYHLVREKAPLTPQRVCDLFRQVADALSEAHRHGLIHRDIKPSNIIVTPDWQAEVHRLRARRVPARNVSETGHVVGHVGYMAPEQARDAHTVDGRADLFSLGASMYWALTGREPYPETGNTLHDLQVRMTTSATPVRQLRPEVPLEISDLIERLMDLDPDEPLPIRPGGRRNSDWVRSLASSHEYHRFSTGDHLRQVAALRRVLLVDDDDAIRRLMSQILKDNYEIHEASNAEEAFSQVGRHTFDLVVVDVNLPDQSGTDLITKLRAERCSTRSALKILLVSGEVPDEALGGLSTSGADDFIAKPFKPGEFLSRFRALVLHAHLRGWVRTHAGNQTLRIPAAATVRTLSSPSTPPVRPAAPSEALSLAISSLLVETSLVAEGHWGRIVRYVRALAGAVTDQGEYSRLKDDAYLDLLGAVAPIYDIGLLAIPRGILMKEERRLDPDESHVMQAHTSLRLRMC